MRWIGLAALVALIAVFMVWLVTGPPEDPELGAHG
jgi:hypothetical protein